MLFVKMLILYVGVVLMYVVDDVWRDVFVALDALLEAASTFVAAYASVSMLGYLGEFLWCGDDGGVGLGLFV